MKCMKPINPLKYGLLILLYIAISPKTHGQKKNPDDLSWEELAAQYECPKWFRDAKFGIWFHWGPQAVPENGGGWYARHMYMQDVGTQTFGENAYAFHNLKYGHPSEFGFKDIINAWKAENFDADELVKFSKSNGARYIVSLANHHDHFDCFASTHHPWNSVNVGPERDIVGEFAAAARNEGLKFGATSHDNRFWSWWLPAFGSDIKGEKKGIPYDGRLTKEGGKSTWWEGLDPADLYGPIPEDRTPEMEEQMKKNWLERHLELVDKYEPDLLYYDSYDFSYGEYGKEVARRLHSNSLKKHGRIETVMSIKSNIPGTVEEIECGGSNVLEEKPWQSEITSTDWFYKKDRLPVHNAQSILEMLINAVCKNGNLLLNIELNPDGTIPPEQKEIVNIVGDWLRVNGEAIYETRPWKVYGDGESVSGKIEITAGGEIRNAGAIAAEVQKEGLHFNQRTTQSAPYAHNEVRYSVKGDDFYIFVLNPAPGELIVPSLGLKDPDSPGKLKTLQCMYNDAMIPFIQTANFTKITMPGVNGRSYPIVLKASFINSL